MKGKKIIVSALAATMVAAPIASLNAVNKEAFAETTENDYTVLGPELSVKRNDYVATAKKGQEVTVPGITLASGYKCDITVEDPLGREVTLNAENKFTADIVGVYTYKFKAYHFTNDGEKDVQDSIATSYELTLTVEGDTGSIEIPENSYFVIPNEFLTNKKLTVPVPTCFANDKEQDFETSNTVDGATIKAYINDAEMTYVAGTGNAAEKKAHFEYTPTTEGSYKLVYKLIYNNEVVAISNTKTIKVKGTLTNNKLYISYAKTPSKSAEAGVKYNLVDLNVALSENSTSYIDAYTKVTVKHVETGEMMDVDYENMTFVPAYTGNYYVTYKAMIPSLGLESDEKTYNILNVSDTKQPVMYLTGNYYLDRETGKTYNKEFGYYDATENKYYTNSEKTTLVEGVVELTGMEIADVYDEIADLKYNVKSYYELGVDGKVTVDIPAAFVRDDYCKANKIKVTRALYVQTNTTDSGKLTLVKKEDGTTLADTDYTQVAQYTFGETYGAGSYVVKYTLQDENNTPVTSDFQIVIKANGSIVKDKNGKFNVPSVTFTYDEETLKTTDSVVFASPSVTDNYDTNLNTRVMYSTEAITSGNVLSMIDEGKVTILNNGNKNDDGKYEVKIADIIKDIAPSPSYIYVAVLSQNSYNSTVVENNRNFVVKKIKLVGGTDDTNAPTKNGTYTWDTIKGEIKNQDATITGANLNDKGFDSITNKPVFDQNSVLSVPSFEFEDEDSEMRFEIKISYMRDGEEVVVDALETGFNHSTVATGSNTFKHTISGATFKVSYAKLYTVTVLAIDSNDNTTLLSFGVRVNDTEPPVIQVVNGDKFSSEHEVGNEFKIPTPDIFDDGEIDENGTWAWSVKWPTGNVNTYDSYVTKFTPTAVGTYIITYSGKDKNGNAAPNSEYRLNVVATEKPEITFTKVMESYDVDWDYSKSAQDEVKIPMATAKDKYFNSSIKMDAPKVVDGKGDEVSVATNGDWYTFVPKTQGKYTVTYTAQGKFLSNTKTLTINVGDSEAPTMSWNNREKDFKQTLNVGDNWTFKFDMINIEDNEDDMSTIINNIIKDGVTSASLDSLKEYATITMTKDGKNVDYTISDNGLKYTFDSTGDYTFTIKLTDKAGNNSGSSYKYTITVKEVEKTEESKGNNAVGTVLIVLSVVILAGVVAYFVITTKKVDKKAIEKKDKKETKDKKNK